jgi:hypothetical protein
MDAATWIDLASEQRWRLVCLGVLHKRQQDGLTFLVETGLDAFTREAVEAHQRSLETQIDRTIIDLGATGTRSGSAPQPSQMSARSHGTASGTMPPVSIDRATATSNRQSVVVRAGAYERD